MDHDSGLASESKTLSQFFPGFLLYAEAELRLSRESVDKYWECLRQVVKIVGDIPVGLFSGECLLTLKAVLIHRPVGISRQTTILMALKRYLRYIRDQKISLSLDPDLIRPPRRLRRDVTYLTPEEIEQFVGTMKLTNKTGKLHLRGLRMRAFVEVILGSALRLSEALSLDRNSIDFVNREVKVIGKGNKERTVFFTDRALHWVKRYLKARKDKCPALFVCQGGKKRLQRYDMSKYFRQYRELSGIKKKITPHILRHTVATTLLFNGCPIGHIKEILGHERLETTCRYYLGLDRRAAKEAHRKYLLYTETPLV